MSDRAVRTSQQHEKRSHPGSEVDGCAEEVESGGVLLHGEMYQTQIVQNLPVKRGQVVGALQTTDRLKYGDKF